MNDGVNDVYENLRKRLDIFPTSFPKSEGDIGIKILKKLYTKEEAQIAVALPLVKIDAPEEVRTISERVGRDVGEVSRILETMAKKGLVFCRENKNAIMEYSLLSFLHGSLEFTADICDPEMADLCEKFILGPITEEWGKSKAHLIRIIPVNKTIPTQTTIRPYDDVIKTIETASSICVVPCFCRTYTRQLGKGCDHPIETCMFLNDYADYLNRVGKGRKLSKEEAVELITKCEEAGLVHISDDIRDHQVICNCCRCSCLSLGAVIKAVKGNQIEAGDALRCYFRLVIDPELCTGCESCVERCWMEALSLEDGIVTLDLEKCTGCGACVYVCPTDALRLERKSKEQTESTLHGLREMYLQMGLRRR